MQVKLWKKNEDALKELIKDPKMANGLLSVAKLANWAISIYIASNKQSDKKSK